MGWNGLTFCYGCSVLTTINLATLTGVVLEWMPGFPVIHTFEDGHRVRFCVTKLKTDVSELVFLAQAQYSCDILVRVIERLGHPACHVVRVVQVRQIFSWVPLFVVTFVTDFAFSHSFAILVARHKTMLGPSVTALAGHLRNTNSFNVSAASTPWSIQLSQRKLPPLLFQTRHSQNRECISLDFLQVLTTENVSREIC